MTARKAVIHEIKIPDRALILAKIENAMRALPLLLPVDDLLDGCISRLAEKYIDMKFEHFNVRKPLTKNEINSQLSKIGEQSEALLETMRKLQEPSIDALNSCRSDGEPTLGELERSLQWLNKIASLATAPNAAKNHKGPSREVYALKIAEAGADDFYNLTGKRPTHSERIAKNGFRDFLAAIFEALDISHCSAEAFAKKAAASWKTNHPVCLNHRDEFESLSPEEIEILRRVLTPVPND